MMFNDQLIDGKSYHKNKRSLNWKYKNSRGRNTVSPANG
jgi:hypothetical protein